MLLSVRIWQTCRVWSVVCKQCLMKNARRFFRWPFYIYRSSPQQMLFQVATCKMLIIFSALLQLASTASAVSEVAVLHRHYAVFSPVSLVFALHMITIWNRKNRSRPWTTVFFSKNRPKPTTNSKIETVTALAICQTDSHTLNTNNILKND